MSVGGGWRFPSCGECPEAVAVFKVLAVHVGLGGLSVPCPCTEAGAAPAAVFGRSQEQGRRERLSEEVGQREGLCSYCPLLLLSCLLRWLWPSEHGCALEIHALADEAAGGKRGVSPMKEMVLCFGIARALGCNGVSCSGLLGPREVWPFWRGWLCGCTLGCRELPL